MKKLSVNETEIFCEFKKRNDKILDHGFIFLLILLNG